MSKIKTRVVEKDIKILNRKKSGLAIKKEYVNVKNIKKQTSSDNAEEVHVPTQYAIYNSKKIIKTSIKCIKNQTLHTTLESTATI